MAHVPKLHDFTDDAEDLYEIVFEGLQKPRKELPSKLLYDDRGSALFEEIRVGWEVRREAGIPDRAGPGREAGLRGADLRAQRR